MTHHYHEPAAVVSRLSTTTSIDRRTAGHLALVSLVLCCVIGLLGVLPADVFAKTKPPRVPRPEPELKILDLTITPTPFAVGNGPLEFSVTVQLPRELEGATVLEVSSLISSPSKTSLRFLSERQEIQPQSSAANGGNRQTVSVHLIWDGQDQRKKLAPAGKYSYEVRTKLLANGEKGLRTSIVAWPKRGTLDVK
ncbi:MAG TPA: hypothetical protein VLS44_11895 [Nitrospira sp.]|nr:hypothetical protein [Nitrospira sp.]